MAVSVLKRPYQYCFSGNPVHYELFSSLAASDNTVQIELRVQFRTVGGAYIATEALPFAPVQGTVKADIKDILESLLQYELPTFTDEKSLQPAPGHTGQFYLQFREVSASNQETTWDDTEAPFAALVLKGGMSRFKYQGNNFWVNYFLVKKPFLTWQLSGRKAALAERMYLLFLNTETAFELRAEARVFFIDGTSAVTSNTITVPLGVAFYVPAGAAQWDLQSLASKVIHYWEISIWNGADLVSEKFRYEADNRNDYNDYTLHYRSSLGSLDSVRIRGEITPELTYEFTKLAVTQQPDYYNGHFFTPQQRIGANVEKQSWTGDIGHMGKEERDRLRDAYLQRETWWAVSGKWWPVNITTTKNTLGKSTAKLFSLPIEWELAHEGDPYYTPENMQVGDAVFESNVCQAFVSGISVVLEDNPLTPGFKKATITFTENDPQDASTQLRYRYYSDALQVDWVSQPYTTLVINVEDNKKTTLELQGVCTNTIYGKLVSYEIDTTTPETPPDTGGGTETRTLHTLTNDTSFSGQVTVFIDNVFQSSFSVGANSSAQFLANPMTGQNMKLALTFSPAYATLFASESKMGTIQGTNVTFFNVNTSDYSITLS